jgi:TatD DNase family protein
MDTTLVTNMPLDYIDSHAHLFFEDFTDDLPQVLARAAAEGVHRIIVPATDLKSSNEAVALASKYAGLYACVGIHPHEAAKAADEDLEQIKNLGFRPKVVAIGEIGMDFHYDFSPPERQEEIFRAQLRIAVERNLPVVIHTREAEERTYRIVEDVVREHPRWREKDHGFLRGVFHCFPGSAREAEYVQRLGFFVSYPGIVTFKKSPSVAVIQEIGIENLLIETDTPYMTPVPFRGKRNEPAYVVLVAKKIAEVLGISEEEVARVTCRNTMRLFGLSEYPSAEKTD